VLKSIVAGAACVRIGVRDACEMLLIDSVRMSMTDTTTIEEVEATPAVVPVSYPPDPTGYAIVETGGKQYRVKVGDRISVERLAVEGGGSITFDRVLLIGGDGETRVGAPVVEGATVVANVDDHYRGEKIVVFKYKPKKRYRKRIGHRQELTHLTITAINA
jgi:large subunit ribosomal protein L21